MSLDCEGKWGMADHLSLHHATVITNRNLARVYSELLRAFERRKLRVTFAFVGAFTMEPEEYRAHPDLFGDSEASSCWLRVFRQDQRRGVLDGWSAPELLRMVVSGGQHEIGSHGFSHLPFDEARTPSADAQRELDAVVWLWARKGLEARTLVYPRNQVGYSRLLKPSGYIGYRDTLPAKAALGGKFRALAREANIFSRSQEHSRHPDPDMPVAIPPGFFLNWRFGIRRRIPAAVTLTRWKHVLDHAAESGGVALVWTHPHNFIDGEGQLELFEAVLDHAAGLIHRELMVNCTQSEYADAVLRRRGIEAHEPAQVVSGGIQ